MSNDRRLLLQVYLSTLCFALLAPPWRVLPLAHPTVEPVIVYSLCWQPPWFSGLAVAPDYPRLLLEILSLSLVFWVGWRVLREP